MRVPAYESTSLDDDTVINAVISGDFDGICEIATIATKSQTIRLTTLDSDVIYFGETYKAASVYYDVPSYYRGEVKNALGFEVHTAELTVLHGDTCKVGEMLWPEFVRSGGMDGANFLLERLLKIQGEWVGFTVFEGVVGPAKPLGMKTVFEVEADTRVFDRPFPSGKISEKCTYVFGGAGCGLDLAPLTATATAAAGSDRALVLTGLTSYAANHWQGGSLRCVGPRGATARRRVASSGADGSVRLTLPLPWPAAGHQVMLTPTCARTPAACAGWGNLQRYRGMPFVPRPETAR